MNGIKKLLLLLIGLQFSVLGYSQPRNLDSLRMELSRTTDDLKRFDLLNNILLDITSFRGDNIDSLVTFEMLAIAQKINNDSLKAISYNWIGSYFFQMKGDNASALEYYFKALPYAEITKDKRRISSIYFDMALVYFNMKDNEKAIEVTRKGGENLPEKEHPLYNFMLLQYQANMVEYFLYSKNIDSASYYIELSSEALVHFENNSSYLLTDYLSRAAFNALSNNIDLADDFFSRALTLQDSVDNLDSKLYFHTYYLPFLLSQNRTDIGIQQSKKLLSIGLDNSNNNMKLTAAQYLRQFYDLQNQTDSAYYYSRMEAQINEDIFSQDNKNRLESLILNDRLRRIDELNRIETYRSQVRQNVLMVGLGLVLIIAFILFWSMREKQKTNLILERTLSDLKATQSQLIQQEKLASLGQLTAGIAHEIKNPLNFVNNFSSVSLELVDEAIDEVEKIKGERAEVEGGGPVLDVALAPALALVSDILADIKSNLTKIHEHGSRADGIVKSMLQHSRGGTGKMEPTDLNALVKEFANLSYHGMRAGKYPIDAEVTLDLDETIGEIPLVYEDFSRVILNICTNAFDAMRGSVQGSGIGDQGSATTQKASSFINSGAVIPEGPSPQVSGGTAHLTVRTRRDGNRVTIEIEDNGPGIPDDIKDKILQPFFTTKKGTQGTGLGLSITHDIVKAHGGALSINSELGNGSTFVISLQLS
jgi:signal transduction histidine kinase